MMKLVLQTPSLQHLAGVKTVTHLWTRGDIFIQIAREFTGRKYCEQQEDGQIWKAIEENVYNKISTLPLPNPCKRQLLYFIKPIGMQVNIWCCYHNLDGYSYVYNIDTLATLQLCWSMHGTVDYAKTAELMVKDQRLDVERRYVFACINCLEDEARKLFFSMSEERRQGYINTVHINMIHMDHKYLLTYFTCTFAGDARRLNNFSQTALRSSWLASRGDSVNTSLFGQALWHVDSAMCEYFYKKLSHEEKENVLEKSVEQLTTGGWTHSSNWLCYLSLMDEKQRRHLFRKCTNRILECFLRWPMQPLFMEAVECGWGYMNMYDRTRLLIDIIRHILRGFNDYDYFRLFWKCWRRSPAEVKYYFLDNIYSLESLFATKKEEFIKFAFNEANSCRLNDLLRIFSDKINLVLMDESVISDAVLLECKQTAALNSENDKQDVEKRLKSEHLSRFIDMTMENRKKIREKCRGI